MARKQPQQFIPEKNTKPVEPKKTRKELRDELKEAQEKYKKEQAEFEEQQRAAAAPVQEEFNNEPLPEDARAELQKVLIWASVGTVVLLAIMYWIFASAE